MEDKETSCLEIAIWSFLSILLSPLIALILLIIGIAIIVEWLLFKDEKENYYDN